MHTRWQILMAAWTMAAGMTAAPAAAEPVKVEVRATAAGYTLVRDGEPYAVRGVGMVTAVSTAGRLLASLVPYQTTADNQLIKRLLLRQPQRRLRIGQHSSAGPVDACERAHRHRRSLDARRDRVEHDAVLEYR